MPCSWLHCFDCGEQHSLIVKQPLQNLHQMSKRDLLMQAAASLMQNGLMVSTLLHEFW